MKRLTNCLNISFHNKWKLKNYVPTMMGSKWKGTGAYSDSYQTITDGILRNDPVRISKGIIDLIDMLQRDGKAYKK